MGQRWSIFLVLVILLASQGHPSYANTLPQFRAFWVDAFGPGLYSETEIDTLVADAKAANMNALIVQVGRRGDCFCNRALMPRTEANIAPYPFDPLQTVIDKAHAQGLEVHAWLSATAIWSSPVPPKDPMHVFNLHGPSQAGADNWLMVRYDGALRGGPDYYLDPGHPAAADYIVRAYVSVVANYEVDGINLDRIRYPDYNLSVNVPSWGYNPVAVARFQAATGRTDIPVPTDPEWVQWRREQITSIVRRIYLEVYAIKPWVRVSADTIAYGHGPQTQGGWESTQTYREVLQDWRGWMEEGIIDLAIPMNYKREHLILEPDNQRRMFEEWADFAKDHQFGRQTAIGTGLYVNFVDGSVAQIRKALAPSATGNFSHGWVGFSYRMPDILTAQGMRPEGNARAELTRALTQPDGYAPPVFASPARVPEMAWKVRPTTGHVLGRLWTHDELPPDQIRVELREPSTGWLFATRYTDGSGWFGFVDLAPGRYMIAVDYPGAEHLYTRLADVFAGRVTMLSATLAVPQR